MRFKRYESQVASGLFLLEKNTKQKSLRMSIARLHMRPQKVLEGGRAGSDERPAELSHWVSWANHQIW